MLVAAAKGVILCIADPTEVWHLWTRDLSLPSFKTLNSSDSLLKAEGQKR